MTSFWPKTLLPLTAEIFAGSAWATPSLIVPSSSCCSRKNASWFVAGHEGRDVELQRTPGSSAGSGRASAEPVPASEATGQDALPWLLSLATEQVFRPFVDSTRVFGNRISIWDAEVSLSLLLTIVRSTRSDFGFFLVPALDGADLRGHIKCRGRQLGVGHGGHRQRRERRNGGDQDLAQGELLLRSGR